MTAPGRTVAVVSTSRVPTGAMVADTSARFPDADGLGTRIRDAARAERSVFVDARELGDAAGQRPVRQHVPDRSGAPGGRAAAARDSVEQAIELNGVRCGRTAGLPAGTAGVADPGAFASARRRPRRRPLMSRPAPNRDHRRGRQRSRL